MVQTRKFPRQLVFEFGLGKWLALALYPITKHTPVWWICSRMLVCMPTNQPTHPFIYVSSKFMKHFITIILMQKLTQSVTNLSYERTKAFSSVGENFCDLDGFFPIPFFLSSRWLGSMIVLYSYVTQFHGKFANCSSTSGIAGDSDQATGDCGVTGKITGDKNSGKLHKEESPLYPSIVSNLRSSFYPIFILNSFLSNVNVFAFSHLDLNKYVFSFACLVDFFVEHDIINPFLHNLMTELMVYELKKLPCNAYSEQW